MFQGLRPCASTSSQPSTYTFIRELEKAVELRKEQQRKRFGVYWGDGGPRDRQAGRSTITDVLEHQSLPAQQRAAPRPAASVPTGHFVLPPFPPSGNDSELIRSIIARSSYSSSSNSSNSESFTQDSALDGVTSTNSVEPPDITLVESTSSSVEPSSVEDESNRMASEFLSAQQRIDETQTDGQYVNPPLPPSEDDSVVIRSIGSRLRFPSPSPSITESLSLDSGLYDSITDIFEPSGIFAEAMPPEENSDLSNSPELMSDPELPEHPETMTPADTTGSKQEDRRKSEYLGECTICFENRRDHVMVPCGHVYCDGCAEQQQERGACFICSREVIMTVKIFL